MIKWIKWAAVVVLAMLFLATVTVQMGSAFAESTNCIVLSSGARVYSPVNVTYNTGNLALNLTFGYGLGIKCSLTYSLDGTYIGEVPLTALKPGEIHVVNPATGYMPLSELHEGTHYLTIKVTASVTTNSPNPPGPPFKPTTPGGPHYQANWQDTIIFTVDTHAPTPDLTAPAITMVTTENKTFQTSNVPLEFIVNEPISHATYNLNGTGEFNIQGNTTLEGLQLGHYTLLLYVWDVAGNRGTQLVHFNVTEPSPASDISTLTVTVAASTMAVCLLFAALVLTRKRKKQSNEYQTDDKPNS